MPYAPKWEQQEREREREMWTELISVSVGSSYQGFESTVMNPRDSAKHGFFFDKLSDGFFKHDSVP
jgi:hypothetical protein